jgi:hypothetical protein
MAQNIATISSSLIVLTVMLHECSCESALRQYCEKKIVEQGLSLVRFAVLDKYF